MQPLAEIQAAIANLPPTAQTRPILEFLLAQGEDLQSKIAGVLLSQEKERAGQSLPPHPQGLCQEASCASCVAQGQELVALGRGAVQADIDTALEWFGGPDLQERMAAIVGKWLSEGRPHPTPSPAVSDPYLVISPE